MDCVCCFANETGKKKGILFCEKNHETTEKRKYIIKSEKRRGNHFVVALACVHSFYFSETLIWCSYRFAWLFGQHLFYLFESQRCMIILIR